MGKRSGVLCDRQHPPWVNQHRSERIAPASPTRLTDSGSRVSVAWPVLQELGESDHQQLAPRTGADVLTLVVERGSTGLRPEGHGVRGTTGTSLSPTYRFGEARNGSWSRCDCLRTAPSHLESTPDQTS